MKSRAYEDIVVKLRGGAAGKRDRRDQAANPETSKEELTRLAAKHPVAFLGNPLLPLLLLEDPGWPAYRAALRALAVATMRRRLGKFEPSWARVEEDGTGVGGASYGSGDILGARSSYRRHVGAGFGVGCYGVGGGYGQGEGSVQNDPCRHDSE